MGGYTVQKKRRNRLGLILGIIMSTTILGGCQMAEQTKSKEELEQGFEKVLAMYPTKNLMAFYDMEGYRDEEFDKDDKGVWVLDSDMSISESKEAPLVTEGMNLRLNRNTRKAKGYYYQWSTSADLQEKTKKKYPITYDETGIHLVEDISDQALKEKIEHFQFFVQYGNFKNLDQYKNIRKMYNSEVPMYELEYQLTNEDTNVKALRKRYDIPTQEAPTMLLKGQGDINGSSVGYKNIEFTFDKKVDVFFTDSIDYQPQKGDDI
ncbi:tandem-type lipoprotein [Enterococcus faecalis]|nr:tandem-type lipoprotein [Enterococcus faecalis]ELS0478043.1 tandem-type lipoprotein [Enterococcus faecalis]